MDTDDRPRTSRAFWWLAVSCVLIVLFSPVPYAFRPLADLAQDDFGLATYYLARPELIQVALYVHIAFGGAALLLSPLQLARRLRVNRPRLHRAVGRTVIACICVAGPAGLVLAPGSQAGWVGTLGFGTLGVLWTTFAILALRAARHGDFDTHRRWATRTFALTYAGVTLRLWLVLLIPLVTTVTGVAGDAAFHRAYLATPFLSWVPNLLLAEYFLRRRGVSTIVDTPRGPAAGAAGLESAGGSADQR